MFKHFKKAKDLSLTKLENLYQQEDQVFRMAVFMDRVDKKMNVTEAAMNARKWFIDYDINAPAINLLRRIATPFLSYTYRIVPLLAETATLRPHKFAKWAGIGYGLNEVGKQVAGGDPDLERVTMRDEYSKTLWGVPYMPPTVLRVPWNSNDGDSQYLDVSRWIPGGDIFEEREIFYTSSAAVGEAGTNSIPVKYAPLSSSLSHAYSSSFKKAEYTPLSDYLSGYRRSRFEGVKNTIDTTSDGELPIIVSATSPTAVISKQAGEGKKLEVVRKK